MNNFMNYFFFIKILQSLWPIFFENLIGTYQTPLANAAIFHFFHYFRKCSEAQFAKDDSKTTHGCYRSLKYNSTFNSVGEPRPDMRVRVRGSVIRIRIRNTAIVVRVVVRPQNHTSSCKFPPDF